MVAPFELLWNIWKKSKRTTQGCKVLFWTNSGSNTIQDNSCSTTWMVCEMGGKINLLTLSFLLILSNSIQSVACYLKRWTLLLPLIYMRDTMKDSVWYPNNLLQVSTTLTLSVSNCFLQLLLPVSSYWRVFYPRAHSSTLTIKEYQRLYIFTKISSDDTACIDIDLCLNSMYQFYSPCI